jgi:uncharacterized BrkB/YihY/UPF0761 family membrane protein
VVRCAYWSASLALSTYALSLVAGFLPGGAVEIVQEQVNRLVSKGDAKLGIGFMFGLAVALWSAIAGMFWRFSIGMGQAGGNPAGNG